MRWYEVQPVFENGKKVRRSSWGFQYHIEYDKNYMSKMKSVETGCMGVQSATGYDMDSSDLFANDWIILENEPIVFNSGEVPRYFRCPRCNELSRIRNGTKDGAVITCNECNMKVKYKEIGVVPWKNIKKWF